MVRIAKVKDKIDISVEFCEKIDMKVINSNYLIIDLKNSKIDLHRDEIYCHFCENIKGEEEFLNYKGILFCEDCLEEIKNAKIGTIIY